MSTFTRLHRVCYGTNTWSPPDEDLSSAFNGFFRPASPTGTPGIQPYFFAITIRQQKEIWERVLTWSATSNAVVGGVALLNGDMIPNKTNELELLSGSLQFIIGTTSGFGGLTLGVFDQSFLKDGDEYYPSLGLNIAMQDGSDELRANTVEAAIGGPATSSFNATFDGHNFPVFVRAVGAASISSLSFTRPATNGYWPYCGADELPIYNTETGEVLPGRSPLM